MNDKYVLAIDQSTQGTKAILFDGKGALAHRTDIAHKQLIDEKGWVSHDLSEIYRNTIQAVKELLAKSGVREKDIVCIGISNQRETSAAWNRTTGEPLSDAIVWQCSRAEDICQRVRRLGVEEQIRQKTGIPLSAYFPAAKYAWMLENTEAVKKSGAEGRLCFGTVDSYLLFRLTKGQAFETDYSNASRTQLFNIQTLEWDRDICEWFGIDIAALPKVSDSGKNYGETDFEGVFEAPVPIYSLLGDSQAALFGQGGVTAGMVKATYGTGSSIMMNTGKTQIVSNHGLVTSLAWGIGGDVTYVLEGNVNYSGASITWLKDSLGLISSDKETSDLAMEANEMDRTYLVPAFSGLGAPYWKPEARAILEGMSRTTGKREIVRAALESIAYQIQDVIYAMKEDTGIDIREVCVDGGAASNPYLMRFQSDISNLPVVLPVCQECSALGAAYMAGLAYGIYERDKLFASAGRKKYLPSMDQAVRKSKCEGWKRAVKRAMY